MLQEVEFELLHVVCMPQDSCAQGQEALSGTSWLSCQDSGQEKVRDKSNVHWCRHIKAAQKWTMGAETQHVTVNTEEASALPIHSAAAKYATLCRLLTQAVLPLSCNCCSTNIA